MEHMMAGSIFKASACSVALAAMLACLSAQAQQQSTRPQSGEPSTGATQAPKSGAGMQTGQAGKQAAAKELARGDRKFVEEAAMGGLAEVELGKLAQQKAQSDQVKQFGARMVQDHGKANDELKQIAETKGVQVPAAPDKSHQKEVDKLAKLSGGEFDREYVAHMLSDHRKDVSAFKKAADNSKDSDIKAFAGKTLPTLHEHLAMVQSLNDSMKNKK
jgi:putative membrane protein